MFKKIDETIAIVLLPIKDLFFEEDLFSKYLERKDYHEIKYKLYSKILKECRVKSYDEVNLLLKKIHPKIMYTSIKKDDIDRYYFELINSISKSFYSVRDGKLVYKYWMNGEESKLFGPYDEGSKIEIFRRFNKKICMDIFSINHILENSNSNILALNNNYSNIKLSDLQLDDILSKGISENHIHGNATLSFSLTWQILMYNNVNKKDINSLNITEYDNHSFKDNPYLYVKLAELIRNLIIVFLKYGKDLNLYDFCCEKSKEEILNLYKIIDYLVIIINTTNNIKDSDESIILKYIEFINKKFNITHEKEVSDIINKEFNVNYIKTYSENIFLFKALEYIKNSKYKDHAFNKLFLHYIRIKNQFYLNLVQSNDIKGLDNFRNFFEMSTSLTGYIGLSNVAYYKLIIRSLFQDKYLKNIEVRLSFNRTKEELKHTIKDFLTAYKEVIEEDFIYNENELLEFPKIGLIFHLLKKKDYREKEKCIYKFYKTSDEGNLYYEEMIEEYKQHINNLLEIRNKMPELSYFILGIDSANLENNAPTEVFAPVYEFARDSKKDMMTAFDKKRNLRKVKSLRFTYHAGEDFRHILSGIRRIDEVVEYCKFHSGDRIGHGTALGINVDKWCNENPVIVIPRGEHLNNLLWIWDIYSSSVHSNPKVSLYLEKKIYELSKDIYIKNVGITTPMLYENYIRGFKSFKEVYSKDDLNMFSGKREDENIENKNNIFCLKSNDYLQVWDSDKLYYSRHCKCYLDRMNEPIFLSITDMDKEIINEIQGILIKKMAQKGIVIEVNPTSNMNIGEIDTIFEHYAFNINKINDINKENVMMTINTDDPMVFNTSLSNEYSYIYYSLIKKGYSKESVLAWIDKIRQYSLDSTFIDKSITNKQYYEFLKSILCKL